MNPSKEKTARLCLCEEASVVVMPQWSHWRSLLVTHSWSGDSQLHSGGRAVGGKRLHIRPTRRNDDKAHTEGIALINNVLDPTLALIPEQRGSTQRDYQQSLHGPNPSGAATV